MKAISIRKKKIPSFDGIVGETRIMQDIFEKIEIAANTDITILITGESGTGKELVAHSIHSRSRLASGPFIAVNSGAMVRELAPAELFGHEKGAFTGATEMRNGLFESAEGGTLFFDEIGSMDHRTQTTILRILENREYRRVGGVAPQNTNARIIAASNSDLRQEVKEGRFREDLFYRFEVFTILVPPLRQRWEDIYWLTQHFICMFNREMNKNIQTIARDTMDFLIKYEWHGNVRELKNVVQRSMLMCEGSCLAANCLPENILNENPRRKKMDIEIGLSLKEIEKRYIERALWWLSGNKAQTARMLGISRKALYNKIKEHRLT